MKFIKVNELGEMIGVGLGDVNLKRHPMIAQTIKDDNGNDIEVQIPDPHYITITPVGYHTPIWDFDKECWTEGKPQDEIDAALNAPKPLTAVDRLDEIEEYMINTAYQDLLNEFGL